MIIDDDGNLPSKLQQFFLFEKRTSLFIAEGKFRVPPRRLFELAVVEAQIWQQRFLFSRTCLVVPFPHFCKFVHFWSFNKIWRFRDQRFVH